MESYFFLMSPENYHITVLLNEAIDGLNIVPNGVYIDATFGGGGHSRAILQRLNTDGKLFAFDQDDDALVNSIEDKRFTLIQHNFREIKKLLRLHGIKQADGILADLGVSSHQLDVAERGFSYRFQAALDMRMNRQQTLTAALILNTYTAEQLQQLLSDYGEVRNAKSLAFKITQQRTVKLFGTIQDLLQVLEPLAIGNKMQYFSQVFQALRIEVNDELGALQDFLRQSLELLKPNGRIAIISFHSAEDRFVKNFFKSGDFQGVQQKDFFGNIERPFTVVTKKPIEPTADEIKKNIRSRSAKLRIAEFKK
jgi:16S rRNA (cytosine1402-N4)-methyltransferase